MIPALTLDIQNLLIIIVAILHAALGLVILIQGGSRRQNILFALIELSLVAWSISMVFYRSSAGPEAVFWAKILYFSALFIPYIFIYFVHSFPEDELYKFKKIFHFLLPLPLLFLASSIFSDRLILGVKITESEPIIYFSRKLEFFYALYIVGYFSWSYLRLAHLYLVSSGLTKTHVGYVLAGTLISTLLATPPNLFLPLFNIFVLNWLGQVVIVVMALAIAYAIARHNLLNIRVIAAEVFSGLIVLILLGEVILANSVAEFIGRLFILIMGTIFSYFLLRGIFQEIRSREEIQRLAESLRKANLELKKLDQLKSEFLSLASHQLRTPLSIIKGYISLIQEGTFGPVSEKAKEVLRKVYFSNERMINLVNDFLNISRIESGRMRYSFEPMRIESVIDNAVDGFNEIAKDRGIKLIWERPSTPLPEAMLDKDKFHQVIMNLIDNAFQYTQVGFIKVKAELDSASPDQVLISVQDTGIGMMPEEIDLAFRRFSRGEGGSKVNTEGLGLGLYLAHKIINDHGGEIWAESEGRGQGTTFYIKIPARAAQAKRVAEFKEFITKI